MIELKVVKGIEDSPAAYKARPRKKEIEDVKRILDRDAPNLVHKKIWIRRREAHPLFIKLNGFSTGR